MKLLKLAVLNLCLMPSLSASAQTFIDYCKDVEAEPAIKKAVLVLKRAVELDDCTAASQALSQQTSLKLPYTTHRGILDLSPLAEFSQIVKLDISSNPVVSFKPLTGLRNLQYLAAQSVSDGDLGPLVHMEALEIFDFDDGMVTDLRPLEQLPRLRSLRIAFPSNERSLDKLAGLPQTLTHLDISGEQIQDISALANLRGLTKLKLPVSNAAVVDYTALVSLPNLTHLSVYSVPSEGLATIAQNVNIRSLAISGKWLTDRSVIGQFKNLESLSMSGAGLEDLSFLTTLRHLKVFNSSWNPKIRDLTPLASLTSLEDLRILDNSVEDLAPLRTLVNLRRLDLMKWVGMGRTLPASTRAIHDLEPLRALTELEDLRLGNNEIEDTTPLAELTKLRYLELDGNRVRNVDGLSSLISLEGLMVAKNPLQSVAGLKSLPALRWGGFVAYHTPISDGTIAKTDDNCPVDAASEEMRRFCNRR